MAADALKGTCLPSISTFLTILMILPHFLYLLWWMSYKLLYTNPDKQHLLCHPWSLPLQNRLILMFKKSLERLDVSADLAQITWTNEFADFNSFPMQKHLGKISAYLNKMSGVTMKLGLDENGELKVMPDFHSVFDAARFALSQYVSIPTDYPIAYADRVGVATCECCGRLFIKNGNRQKYCDNPECKKERNRRKSRTAYRRKIQEENDNRWA